MPVVCNDRCRGRCPGAVHRRWWTSLWCRSDKFQLSVLTAGMRGRLHGYRAGSRVHRDTAPTIRCRTVVGAVVLAEIAFGVRGLASPGPLLGALSSGGVSVCVVPVIWYDYTFGVLGWWRVGLLGPGFLCTPSILYWIVKYSWSVWSEGGYIYLDMSENTCGVSHSCSLCVRKWLYSTAPIAYWIVNYSWSIWGCGVANDASVPEVNSTFFAVPVATIGVLSSWSMSPRIRVSAACVGRSLIPRRWYAVGTLRVDTACISLELHAVCWHVHFSLLVS